MSCVNDSIQITLYVGDEGTVVEVDCDPNDLGTVDISDSITTQIKVLFKDLTTAIWDAEIHDSTHIRYTITSEDTLVEGLAKAQSYVVTPSGKWHGKIALFNIEQPLF
jgi:hypothetical protein